MYYAPIILFVYRRLDHLKLTVDSLKKNKEIKKSNLIIFSDGPKSKLDYDSVIKVRKYINNIKGFKNIKIMPNLRCKSKWWYEGKFRFFKANYLIPFTNNAKFVPKFLKGKSKGLFAICKK